VQQIEYYGKPTDSVAWWPFGYHAQAENDKPAVMVTFQGGDHVHLPGSPEERPTVADGENVVYHPSTPTTKIHFKANGDLDIESGTSVNVTAPVVTVNADTSSTITSPSHTYGDGSNDIIALMSEMCQLVHDSQVRHDSGDRSMTTATKAAWDALKAKVETLT
jgi:hypothetical protein